MSVDADVASPATAATPATVALPEPDDRVDVAPDLTICVAANEDDRAVRRAVAAAEAIAQELAATKAIGRYEVVVADGDPIPADGPDTASSADVVVFTSADAAIDPAEVGRAVRLLLLDESDVIVAFRRDPWERSVGHAIVRLLFTALVRVLFGVRLRDAGCPIIATRRSVLDTFDAHHTGPAAAVELLVRARQHDFRVAEFGIESLTGPSSRRPTVGAGQIVELRALRSELRDAAPSRARSGPRERLEPLLRTVPRRDRWTLWVPALGGIGLRWWEVLVGRPRCDAADLAAASQSCLRIVGDMGYFRGQAHYLAKGHGYVNMVALTVGRARPGAYHPPAFPTLLAAFNILGLRSLGDHRLALSVFGGAGVVLIGVVARQLGGRHRRAVGLAAATIAAASPLFWLNDTQAMSESLYVPLVALLIAALYGFWRRPGWWRAASIGALVAVITLTRAEGLAMLSLLIPLLIGMRSASVRRRVVLFGVATGACLLVLAPWVTYNLARFPETTYLTTSAGDALLFRSCDATFYGHSVGYYDNVCAPKPNLTIEDESAQDHRSRALALDYIGAHLGRVPVVVLARVARMWEIYKPFENAELSGFLDNRGATEARLALYAFWAMLVPAAYGLASLRRRGLPISPLVGMVVLVTGSTAMTSAVVRYRASADLALLLLAAVGVGELWHRHVRQRATGRPAVRWRRRGGKVALATLLLAGTVWSPLPSPATATAAKPGAAGRNCDKSESLSRLLDAFDARSAAAPAARLRVGAPARIAADLDLVVATEGDIMRLPPDDLQRVVHELAEYASDNCSLFGVW